MRRHELVAAFLGSGATLAGNGRPASDIIITVALTSGAGQFPLRAVIFPDF